jgi:hypothetical protein
MHHQAHIGAINPHTEGNRCNQHRAGLGLKLLQGQKPAFGIHPGVIGQSRQTSAPQSLRPTLYAPAGAGVEQGCTPRSSQLIQQ